MHRRALESLQAWATRPVRKPLVIRGARQVGKSTLVRLFAKAALDGLLEIDFEANPAAASLFHSKDPATILGLLEAAYGVDIRVGRTLLFLDEIQAAPEVFSCLRYFHERLPDLHVIAAGSLLDFALGEGGFSMPVGRIEYLHLGPMTFEEFLLAEGLGKLERFLAGYVPTDHLPAAIHAQLMRRFREYLILGGMPAVIGAYLRTGRYGDSEAEKQSILSTIRDDFAKYGRQADRLRLEKILARIPRLVGTRFKYSLVDRDERSRELSKALDLLCRAGIAHRVRHSAANGIPLGAEASDRAFKVLFLDVGLLCRSAGLTIADLEGAEDVMLVNTGAICEQFVGQHLLQTGETYDEPEVFCWMREKAQSNAEVDYLMSVGRTVIPVEVKSGKTGTLKSLHVFMREKRRDFGLRLNSDVPSVLDAKTSLADGNNRPFRLLSLPLYMVEQAPRLCRACL